MAKIVGTDAPDETLNGTNGDDVIKPKGGWNYVNCHDGADIVYGGPDRNIVDGDEGDDTLFGGASADFLSGGGGSDVIHGGDGNDSLSSHEFDQPGGIDLLLGEDGDDTITLHSGDTADGGDGFDVFILNVWSEDGSTPTAGYSADFRPMDNGEPIDAAGARLIGFEYGLVQGGDGDDYVRTGHTAMEIRAGGGDDTIILGGSYRSSGGAGNDYIRGGRGGNELEGDDGADTLIGRHGYDTLVGGDGDDLLTAAGRAQLRGDAGADRLEAGDASRMSGGTGPDVFVLKTAESLGSLIGDLGDLVDSIDLSAIDADLGDDGDQAFILVENFGGAAGQMRLVVEGNVTFLETDRDGDGLADALRLTLARGDHTGFDSFVL